MLCQTNLVFYFVLFHFILFLQLCLLTELHHLALLHICSDTVQSNRNVDNIESIQLKNIFLYE